MYCCVRQVSEVLSMEIPRLSINGWFHGPAPEPELAAPEPELAAPASPDLQKPHNEVVSIRFKNNHLIHL